jgi:3',5'-cyclic-nucleotide phosphodiesterase
MDYAACNVVYVDRAAKEDKLVKREDVIPSVSSIIIPDQIDGQAHSRPHSFTLEENLQTLLATFGEGMLMKSSVSRRLTYSQYISALQANPVYRNSPS